MYRCMTCDNEKDGSPEFVRMSRTEAIGLCPECIVIVRSFNTLKALAEAEDSEAEHENAAKARLIAQQNYGEEGVVEFDDDAKVSVSINDEGNVRGAYVQAWVWVWFTANTKKKGEGR